jgi:hypothetical protein
MLDSFEWAEKRAVVCSFLFVKMVSIVALVTALILMEAGSIRPDLENGVPSRLHHGPAGDTGCRRIETGVSRLPEEPGGPG